MGAIKRRFVRATEARVVVCDCSDSMLSTIGSLGLRKHEQLRIALEDALIGDPLLQIIAFSTFPKRIATVAELPPPSGSTNLHGALQMAAELKPRRTIIISDGEPNSETLATEVARDHLTGSIDTIYCGPEGHPGCDYLHSLARLAGGRGVVWEGREQLTAIVRHLLQAPVAQAGQP
jgi:hypothetical protein